MELPLPAAAPLTPDCVAVQAKVVPGVVLESVIAEACPEQTEEDATLAVAVGVVTELTVNVCEVALQPATASFTETVYVPAAE